MASTGLKCRHQALTHLVHEMGFRRYATAWSCGALLVVISLSQTLCKTPLLRIIELDICRSYYQIHNPSVIQDGGFVDEEWCKIFPVQQKLASINGYNVFFSALLGYSSFLFSDAFVPWANPAKTA